MAWELQKMIADSKKHKGKRFGQAGGVKLPLLLAAFLTVAGFSMAGCDTSTATRLPAPTGVELNLNYAWAAQGGTRQFTASVEPAGASQALNWTVEPQTNGVSISSNGLLSIGKDAPLGLLTVRATAAGAGLSDTATVTVTEPGRTMALYGQVWAFDVINENHSPLDAGRRVVSSELGGKGLIVGGELYFSIGSPDSSSLSPIGDYHWMFDQGGGKDILSFSDDTVRITSLLIFQSQPFWGMLSRGFPQSERYISYVYVDRPLTIVRDYHSAVINDWQGTRLVKFREFRLELEAGWNALAFREEGVAQLGDEPQVSLDVSLDHDDHQDIKWILRGEWHGGGGGGIVPFRP